MKNILTVIGTRPEAIKLAPVIEAIKKQNHLSNKICITKQHTDLLDPFIEVMGISFDYQLETIKTKDSLHLSAANILRQFSTVFEESKPDLIIVQGDTTTAFIAALAAFYSKIPIAHVEGGLRTGDMHSPWPEEAHRCLIDKLATYFFVPTLRARDSLLSEGIKQEQIWIVGNTAIDAVRLACANNKPFQSSNKRVILVTIHRRENHGTPLKEICHALLKIAEGCVDINIVLIMHSNPAVQEIIKSMLSGVQNINLRNPTDHHSFIQLLQHCTFVITDSGGIQEEITYLGKAALILRETTERHETLETGNALLVGTKSSDIIKHCHKLLENEQLLANMSKVSFPYGDGYAAERIANILNEQLNGKGLYS
jgi:UDP-N-acetylglucosamine 2-epimerase (non-hydrolysing)